LFKRFALHKYSSATPETYIPDYDTLLLHGVYVENLDEAIARLDDAWGTNVAGGQTIKPPSDPKQFFARKDHLHSQYGKDFFDWYSSSLLAHGRLVLRGHRAVEVVSRAGGDDDRAAHVVGDRERVGEQPRRVVAVARSRDGHHRGRPELHPRHHRELLVPEAVGNRAAVLRQGGVVTIPPQTHRAAYELQIRRAEARHAGHQEAIGERHRGQLSSAKPASAEAAKCIEYRRW